MAAFLPEAGDFEGRHILIREEKDESSAAARKEGLQKVEMANLRNRAIAHEGGAVLTEPRLVLAAIGTHTVECLACCERFSRSEMAEYCCKKRYFLDLLRCPSR